LKITTIKFNKRRRVVLGVEKHVFGLHFTMFTTALDLWSSNEQKEYWKKFNNENLVIGTYAQTELGIGLARLF
jgi:hypothetical protein